MDQQMAQPYGGMTGGGLPSLNAPMAPMAQQVQSQGRGEDTMLVHMTPGEINSLQGLAMAHGGSLTINPETGLPEAGFLGNILKKLAPTLLGAGLMFIPGVNAIAAAGMVGAGSVLKTGSLKKGLLAGLSAYGGASLAGGLGAGNVFGEAAKTAAPAAVGTTASTGAIGSSADLAREVTANAAKTAAGTAGAVGNPALAVTNGAFGSGTNIAGQAVGQAAGQAAGQTVAKQGLAGIAQGFGDAAKAGIPKAVPSFIANRAPMIAGMGLMQGVSGAMTGRPSGASGSEAMDNSYQGPYYAQERKATFAPTTEELLSSSKQRKYYDIDTPEIYNTMGQIVQPGAQTVRGTEIMQPIFNPKAKKGQPMYNYVPVRYMGGVDPEEETGSYTGYAHGGEVQLSDGAFVLDARTVSEIGNGSSNAGMDALSRMGGLPVQGRGDGVSDSVPARIGKNQPARVARDEVIMPADVVRRIGKGNPKRGADKLYALMNKAHNARKKAGRGQDTKLRHGLG